MQCLYRVLLNLDLEMVEIALHLVIGGGGLYASSGHPERHHPLLLAFSLKFMFVIGREACNTSKEKALSRLHKQKLYSRIHLQDQMTFATITGQEKKVRNTQKSTCLLMRYVCVFSAHNTRHF